MISIIITTYQEEKTLSRAIYSVLNQNLKEEYEILVIGPDKGTKKIVKNFFQYPQIKYLKDKGKGKPSALNLGFEKAKGEILILTDGDVLIKENVLNDLLKSFKNDKIGAVSGRPISINSRNTLFGFWSHFLTQAAHQWRLKGGLFPCSGYLYAIRNVIGKIPKNVLAEDGIITQIIRKKGYQVNYAPTAEVYVKYPDNLQDWLRQKTRSTGGYVQKQSQKERNIFQEIFFGFKLFFTYPQTFREYFQLLLLYFLRLYLWLRIFWRIKIKKEKFEKIWQTIESTK
ncbi:MAG: glycosyltransferase [Patescibacteria group bacterium]|jgi:cellulose synthase/poly-beta-1,6-N-acetylglucosamine synthase-like glycosyltransferase|nr:glycosyltransferase [Patescibacteria group bacterium]